MSTTFSPARVASCRLASTPAELEAHFAIRRTIFVELQALFEDDRDERDRSPVTLHAIATVGNEILGAVRLYPLGGGQWRGDRLAVLPKARAHQLGAMLVQFAVATMAERGGTRMIAQVQVINVGFFERLGWVKDGEAALYRGVMHQPMAIAP